MMETDSHLRFADAQLATGVRLHYAEQGDPSGEAIVFIHGWPDSWFTFSRVLAALPTQYHAFALDMRGFGDSQRPGCCYSIDDFASDVVAFLDSVNVQQATLVGHSFGTFVARRVAETNPARVARLVLIGSAATPANDVLLEVQAIVQDLSDPLPEEFVREFQASTAYAPVPDAFFERIVVESLKLPARLYREVIDSMIAYTDADQLGQISAPTLVVWGEHDALFPREEQERLVAAIPDARLRIYEEIGHCPNWECPEQVARDIDRFMQGTP